MPSLLRLVVCALLCMTLCGCADRPSQIVDLDQYVFEQTLQQCHERTTNLLHDAPELTRRTAFEQCMSQNGYEKDTYAHLWINI